MYQVFVSLFVATFLYIHQTDLSEIKMYVKLCETRSHPTNSIFLKQVQIVDNVKQLDKQHQNNNTGSID